MRDELQTARRNFPRAEYQLVKDSFPETLHHLSPAKLNDHIERCEKLIQSYRVRLTDKESLRHAWKGPDEHIGSKRLIRYRMNELNACLRKFRTELRKTSAKKKSASAKKAVSATKVRSARKKTASTRAMAKSAKSSGKASAKSRSLKAKPTMSAKMKTAKPALRTRKARSTNGRARKEATLDEMSFAPGIEQKYSRAVTLQPKMRLPRRSLKKGGQDELRGREERDILQTNSINPALRRR